MVDPIKITSTLADETRYQIYEFMLKQKRAFSVQDIAEQFGIHPNVARLHLTKLSEINVITADFVKTGKGGRPGRIYKASDEGVTLSFPKRNDRHLMKWLLQLIHQLGPNVLESAKNISYKDGFNEITSQLAAQQKLKQTISFEEKLTILQQAASMIGYIPKIVETPNGKKITFTIYNCPFNHLLPGNTEIVCALHESYLKGQVDALFPTNDMIQFESMVHHCELCQYEIYVEHSSSS